MVFVVAALALSSGPAVVHVQWGRLAPSLRNIDESTNSSGTTVKVTLRIHNKTSHRLAVTCGFSIDFYSSPFDDWDKQKASWSPVLAPGATKSKQFSFFEPQVGANS